ncbi:MAG: phenylacetic acid degradation operon negative regulatory protein, partial [Pseudonocardiales bacterium]|nr:phenylacetic acid degradation operon negative regulatory protein [Pseudonocardiales bacterium]
DLDEHEALVVRTAVIDAWREFPAVDPELPDELLPRGWPQPRARALFTGIYDVLGLPASARFRTLVSRHDPESGPLVAHHTSTDALRLCE